MGLVLCADREWKRHISVCVCLCCLTSFFFTHRLYTQLFGLPSSKPDNGEQKEFNPLEHTYSDLQMISTMSCFFLFFFIIKPYYLI